MRRLLLLSSTALLLSACSFSPNHSRPDAKPPEHFRQFGDTLRDDAPGSPSPGSDAIKDAWWQDLGDDTLNGLVQEALANNQDLVRATARVDQFAGSLQSTRSAFFPQFGYSAGAGREKIPPLSATTTVNAGLTADWEIDLFGRVRSASQAARAELLSSQENRQAVILSLVTSVVSGYVNLRSLDRQLDIAMQTAKSREDAFKLFDLRHKGGVISGVEYAQQESEYEAARAAIPGARQAVVNAENTLAVLLGRSSARIPRGKEIDTLILAAPPAGLPSGLLERRPDLRSAEQSLIAANARIGEARSQYFPRISLTGLFGGSSNDLDTLFDSPARTWRYAGSITGPIFRFGAIKGQVETSKARERELLAVYQSAVQNAFADVDRSLSQIQTSAEKLEAQTRQEAALGRYARLARLRYDGGYTSYIDVLDAERSLFSVQLARAQSQADTVIAVLNLYKALGGRWTEHADPQNAAATENHAEPNRDSSTTTVH
jgi:multidrug efflux system outer membrane protein